MSEDYMASLAPRGSGWPVAAFPTAENETDENLRSALESTQNELVACQRLALLGSLAGMAAHEFNNLMTPVVALVEAASTAADPALTRKALDRTLIQVQRAIGLSDHLLALAHREYRPAELCSVAAAVREALESAVRPFQKDGIEVRIAVPEELRVCAQEALLCQVLLNLLLNARQAMQGRRGALAITATADADHVQIDVRDSGKGIPPDRLATVFNPFLAADPRARPQDWQTVGLGLSVCRLIAHHHGATLRALPNDGPGCTFRLRWPKHPPTS